MAQPNGGTSTASTPQRSGIPTPAKRGGHSPSASLSTPTPVSRIARPGPVAGGGSATRSPAQAIPRPSSRSAPRTTASPIATTADSPRLFSAPSTPLKSPASASSSSSATSRQALARKSLTRLREAAAAAPPSPAPTLPEPVSASPASSAAAAPPVPPRNARRADSVLSDSTPGATDNNVTSPRSLHTPSFQALPTDEVAILKGKLRAVEQQYHALQHEHSRCAPRLERRAAASLPAGVSAERALEVMSDRETLAAVVRAMPKEQRTGLLAVIADGTSDIQAQIDMLVHLKEVRRGVLDRLNDTLCSRVMRFLDRDLILNLRLVSKRFDRLATAPAIWRDQCKQLEATWDGTIDLSNYRLGDDGDWLGLYKRLWQREKQWTNGEVRSLVVLPGHTNYVTSLHLSGETLISGSYDDTIRIWHLPYGVSSAKAVPSPQVIPAKSVSSLDYYAPEQVLVTGSHDVGRASVWRQVDGEWKVERILSGHLHGTRAVAWVIVAHPANTSINAQWLISVGSDKAIVVWDWRTGNKIVRFGQQTNVCVGMNLLDSFVITATVDGVIRTFSINRREMLGSFRLSELAHAQPEYADKLKDVGVGALGMLTWFEAEGRFMACATKDIVIRLAWDWATPEEVQDMEDGVGASAAGARDPAAAKHAEASTPLRTRVSTSSSPSPRPHSPRTPRAAGAPSPVYRPSPAAGRLVSTLTNGTDNAGSTSGTASKYALMRRPRIVEILDITGTERGAFEAGRVRIITSRRLSAKAGAERRVSVPLGSYSLQVIVGTERPSVNGRATMQLVPLGGAWETRGRQAGLHLAAKNPMSLALDHDKLVYGCNDGSIVVAGFVGAESPRTT